MVRGVTQVQSTEKNKQATKQPNDISICREANVVLMKLNLLLSACTSGQRIRLFFSSPSFTVKCSCMPRYHGILYLLWCQRGTLGATIWRICWLQAGVYFLHMTTSRASQVQWLFWWKGNSKKLDFFLMGENPQNRNRNRCVHTEASDTSHHWCFMPTEPLGCSTHWFYCPK